TGTITYRKTLVDEFSSDEKLFGRLSEKERIKHNNTRNYIYEGRMIVSDLAGNGRAQTRTKIDFKDNEFHKIVQTEFTNCHSWEPERLITAESTDRKLTVGTGDGEAESYSLSVNGDKFSLGFTFPEFTGKYTHTTNSTYKNLCPDSPRRLDASSNDDVVRVERGGASIEGDVDPRNPDVLEGSKTWFDTVAGKKSFVYTVTWKLRRKAVPLMITDIRFYEPLYPSPNDWHEINDKDRAVDGNQVKIVATVANFGATDKSATVNFKELKENVDLPDGAVTATIPANGQKDVEMIWDTSGYAWKQSGADVVPEMNRRIEVKIPDDSMQKDLTVIPKPVVFVPSFWQMPDSYDKFRDYFKAVNDKWGFWFAQTNPRNISTDNAEILDKNIRDIQKRENAWHVDVISLMNGGLTARVYVNSQMPTLFDGRPAATHLVMIGVPNNGTPCAVGAYGLSFKMNTFNWDAVAELSPDSMKRFNLLVNNTNGTKFAALAIHIRNSTCQEDETPGDGMTPLKSAIWRTKVHHINDLQVSTVNILGELPNFKVIYKWLAVSPKGDHNPDPSTLAGNSGEQNFGTSFQNAAFAQDDETDPKPEFKTVAPIKAKSTTEIEIPLTNSGSEFSIILFTSPEVSATLLDDKGAVVGTNLADSPEAHEIFRTITVKKTFQKGKWKLRLENRANTETEAGMTAFIDYNQKVKAQTNPPVAE
ncbi:MAG TPA: hypothetical protein PKY59_22365, partial [Pyrinomonadaceae bacterium]|nr:hypothetical protein [Pyrinomonadaceae bacterium]